MRCNMNKLALHGGTPARSVPLPTSRLGGSLIGDEELAELTDVIRGRSPFRFYGLNTPDKATRLEQESRQMLGVPYTLAVSSGSAALACAMVALGVGAGDEVILPVFGWHSDYSSILLAGALPVFAGIDDTLSLDPEDLKARITDRTKAIIVIHYQGAAGRVREIVDIAHAHGIKVIEDNAQAFGGQYKGQYLGTIGDIGIASFQYNKMLTAGEGGLFYTRSEEWFARAVRFHDLGLLRGCFLDQLNDKELGEASLSFPGYQFRITELQAALLLAQFRKLPYILDTCRGHYQVLSSLLTDLGYALRPVSPGHCGITVFIRFDSAEQAKRFSAALTAEGVPCGPSSSCANLLELPMVRAKAMPFHSMPPFGPGGRGEDVQYANQAISGETNEILQKYTAIQIGVQYTKEDVMDIVTAIRKVHTLLPLEG